MTQSLLQGAGAGALGVLSLAGGGIWSVHQPSRRTRAVVQHIAAGTIFAGLVAGVFAQLLETSKSPWCVTVDMILGLGTMLAIRTYAHAGTGLALAIIVDVLADGVLMGISVVKGSPVAVLFVVAFVPELTLLGLTLTDELGGKRWKTLRRIGVPALVGAGVVAGGVLGALARSGPPALATGIESYGAIVLAYLITEELLREAHQLESKPWIAAMFFVGFIPFFIAAIAVR